MTLQKVMGHVGALQQVLNVYESNIGAQTDPNSSTQAVKLSTVAHDGNVTGLQVSTPRIFLDHALAEEIRQENTNVGYAGTIGEFLGRFDRVLGQPGTLNSITNQVARLQTAFARFSARPENLSARNEVVTMASNLADTLNRVEEELQRARQTAENEIESSIKELKGQLKIVADSNLKIVSAQNNNRTAPVAQDTRRVALNEVSTMLQAQIHVGQQGDVTIYGPNNINMLREPETPITFTAAPTLGAASKYPNGGLNGLMIAGQDVTAQLGDGRLKALFEIRDKIFPGLSEQFAQMAEGLKEELNAVHNSASSYPGAAELVSSKAVAGTDTFYAQGQFRIASLDGTGTVQNVGDVNLAGVTTVNGFVAAINGALGAGGTASVTNGRLQIVGANGRHIAINENTSQVLNSTVKVELFNNVGASIGVYNYNTQALGSNAAIVAQMNTDFGVNARAELVGNKIHISTLGANQMSLDDHPRVFGATVRSKGASHYFGLNDFYVGETNALSPHASASLKVSEALQKDASLLSHGVLNLTAIGGQTGTTNQGFPNAAGVLPAHNYMDAFDDKIQFYTTSSFSGRSMGFHEYMSATMGYVGAEAENAKDKKEMAESQRDNFKQSYERSSRKSLREMLLTLTEFVTAMRSLHSVISQTLKLEQNLLSIVR